MNFSVPWENRPPHSFSSVTREVTREVEDGSALNRYREELRAVLSERDPEMYNEGLLALGGRLEADGRVEEAREVYRSLRGSEDRMDLSAVVQGASSTIPSNHSTWRRASGHMSPPLHEDESFANLRRRAQARLDAITGVGSSALRTEFLLRHLARETMEPTTLVGMTAASAAFRLTRLATLSSLAGNPGGHFFSRGLGARVTAGLLGFAVEATVFPLAGRGAGMVLGRELDWTLSQVGREVASSFLVLGAMKLTGMAAQRLVGRGSAPPFRGGVVGQSLQQTGMFAGIFLGHHLETAVGLRPHLDNATTFIDSLAMLIQFNAAGRLAQGMMGERFRNWEWEMDRRAAGLHNGAIPTFERSSPQEIANTGLAHERRAAGRTPGSPLQYLPQLRSAFSGRLAATLPAMTAGLLTLIHAGTAHASFEIGNASSSQEILGIGASLFAMALGAIVYRGTRRGAWLGGIWKSGAPRAPEGMQEIVASLSRRRNNAGSGLLPIQAASFSDTLAAIRGREVSEAAGLALLVEVLQVDWIKRIQSHRVRVHVRSFQEFRDHIVAKGGKAPDWMLPILTSPFGEFAEVHEAVISAQQMHSYDRKNNDDPAFFDAFQFSCGLATYFTQLLNLPKGSLYEPQASGALIVRYLPTSLLLEMGGNLYGSNSVGTRLVSRLISEGEMRTLAKSDERPMLISDEAQSKIHTYKNVHPFVAWEHDVFHNLKIGSIPARVRSEWPELYDAMVALQDRFPEQNELITGVRGSLFEGDHSDRTGNGRLFAHIYSRHPGKEFLRALWQEMNSRFSGHPRRGLALYAFEATFGPNYR